MTTGGYLERLNAALRAHPQFEEGMAFTAVYPAGIALLDPRLLQMQRGERPNDLSYEPFVAAIESVAAETKGGSVPMDQLRCPVCGAASGGGHSIGDATVIICAASAGTIAWRGRRSRSSRPVPSRSRILGGFETWCGASVASRPSIPSSRATTLGGSRSRVAPEPGVRTAGPEPHVAAALSRGLYASLVSPARVVIEAS